MKNTAISNYGDRDLSRDGGRGPGPKLEHQPVPLSIALGNDRVLQDRVFASQQNYLLYPQFGSINFLSNFNHNTWHSGNFAVEKRYARGAHAERHVQLVEVAEQ